MQIAERVYAEIARHGLIAPGDLVIAAVSGGPDSLALLRLLADLRGELGFALHVAHLDHMLRGAESADEAAFVAATARAWGLPATIEAVDVAALARQPRANLHDVARRARYAFLARVAGRLGAQSVATAHQADDQAETVLMHLLRGSGAAGLRGMRARTPWAEWAPDQAGGAGTALIRPLLSVGRAEIEQYCAAQGLQPRHDPSNADRRFVRNRIRHDLLPQLAEYNPQIVAALGRTAAVCADEYVFIEQALAAVWPALARRRENAIDFAGAAWRALHPALQRAALRRAHALLGGDRPLGLEHVEAARAAIGRGVGRRVELPGGLLLTVGYDEAFTLGAVAEPDGPQLAQDAAPLPTPGRLDLARGWAISAECLPADAPGPSSAWEAALDADALGSPLLVRRRRAGDRVQLAGGRGHRRIQDVFVDARLPRALRAAWPLVTVDDEIAWVAGVCVAERFAARPATQRIVRVRVEPPDA